MRCQLGAATSETHSEKERCAAVDRTGRAGAAAAAAGADVWVPLPAGCCTGVDAAAADTSSVALMLPKRKPPSVWSRRMPPAAGGDGGGRVVRAGG